MNSIVQSNLKFVYLPITVFVAVLAGYIFIDGILKICIEKSYYLVVIFFSITSGYNIFVLNKLNSLDKLDNVRDDDAKLIKKQTLHLRKVLGKVIPFSIYCAAILLVSSFIEGKIPHVDIFWAVFSSFTIAVGVFLLNLIAYADNQIIDLIDKVNDLSSIEKKRQTLLSKMRRDAEKSPFSSMDVQLQKYKNVVNK